MKRPRFLSVEDVICIHANTIEHEGGLGGIRDYPLLESATMMPQQQFEGRYLHQNIPAMAGAYLFHITQNHPFRDGNKRTGAMSVFVFLDANGFDLTASEAELEKLIRGVASSEISKDQIIRWMGKHSKRRNRRGS